MQIARHRKIRDKRSIMQTSCKHATVYTLDQCEALDRGHGFSSTIESRSIRNNVYPMNKTRAQKFHPQE